VIEMLPPGEPRTLSRLRGRAGGAATSETSRVERVPTRRFAPTSPASGRGAAEFAAKIERHSASALYFFSAAFSSVMAASGSAPVFLTPSAQVLTRGSAAFFQAAVCSPVSL